MCTIHLAMLKKVQEIVESNSIICIKTNRVHL